MRWELFQLDSRVEQHIEIAGAVEDTKDFDAGTALKLTVENEVTGKLGNDPRADVFVAAEIPQPAQAEVARQQMESVEEGLLDPVRCARIVGADVGVDDVHILKSALGEDELSVEGARKVRRGSRE